MSLSENQAPEIRLSFADDAVLKQRRQMFIALTLLLVALVMILTKDRDFWFPSAPVFQSTSEPMEETFIRTASTIRGSHFAQANIWYYNAESKATEAGNLSRVRSGIRGGARRCEPDRASSPGSRGRRWRPAPHRTSRQQFCATGHAPAFHFQPGSPSTTGIGCGRCDCSCHSGPSFPQRYTDPFPPGRT